MFLAAVAAGSPVQPVALRYGADASAQTIVAFRPKESFLANFLRLIGEPPRVVEVVFLQPIVPGDAEGRRRIAELARARIVRSEEHTSELQSLMRISYAVFCLKKTNNIINHTN